ncbi:MAG: hypothetical protein ACXABY_22265 [Candidatus Thorarchaeota archaeon]
MLHISAKEVKHPYLKDRWQYILKIYRDDDYHHCVTSRPMYCDEAAALMAADEYILWMKAYL